VTGRNEYPAKAGEVNRYIARYTNPSPWCWCLAERLASGD